MEDKKTLYPSEASSYELLGCIGKGASGVVMRAKCIPLDEEVAIKVIDLEHCPSNNLEALRKEIQAMSLCSHANVVCYHTSFVHEDTLWLVMDFLAGGSCSDIIRFAFPNGLEENLIATILKETLKGICYFHKTGRIHRDIKAGNILVNADGEIQIGDFGVSACLADNGEKSRHTFVGTPCWMAPEVMEQVNYDYSVDIWSFGITALELAKGRAPFSEYPPMKVLLLTLQNAPPTLDADSETEKGRFSGSFRDLIEKCLQKDPSKRPQAHKLLEHKFFKHAKKPDYIVSNMLRSLPPLMERYKMMASTSTFSLFRTTSQVSLFPESNNDLDQGTGPKWDFSDTQELDKKDSRYMNGKYKPRMQDSQTSVSSDSPINSSGEVMRPKNDKATPPLELRPVTASLSLSSPAIRTTDNIKHDEHIPNGRVGLSYSIDGVQTSHSRNSLLMQKVPRLDVHANPSPALSPATTSPNISPRHSPISSPNGSLVNLPTYHQAGLVPIPENDHADLSSEGIPRVSSFASSRRSSIETHHLAPTHELPSNGSNPDFLSGASGDDHDEHTNHKPRKSHKRTESEATKEESSSRHHKHHHKHHHKRDKDSKDKEHQDQIQALEQQVQMLTMLVQQGQQQQHIMQLMLSRFQAGSPVPYSLSTSHPETPALNSPPPPQPQPILPSAPPNGTAAEPSLIPMLDMLTTLQTQVASLRKENEQLKTDKVLHVSEHAPVSGAR